MQEHLAHSFTVRIEVVLKGILNATQVFQAVYRPCWILPGIVGSDKETHVSLQQTPLMLQEAASSTFFSL
jgi:hypothetical protein